MKKTFIFLTIMVLILSSTNESEAFVLSGDIEGGITLNGITYIVAVTVDSLNVQFGLGLAPLGNGAYSIADVDSGSYIIFAYQDLDLNFTPSIDDYFGYYGGDIPQILEVTGNQSGLDIEIAPLPATSISGTITYSGVQTGLTLIEAASDPYFEDIVRYSILFDSTANGQYTFFVDEGVYYIRGYVDSDLSFSLSEGDPTGFYGSPSPVDVTSASASEIDFELFDNPAGVEDNRSPIGAPVEYLTLSAVPNPFNPITEITYTTAWDGEVYLTMFDIDGRIVRQVYDGYKSSGSYSLQFDASGLSSGIYFINLLSEGQSKTLKVMLLK